MSSCQFCPRAAVWGRSAGGAQFGVKSVRPNLRSGEWPSGLGKRGKRGRAGGFRLGLPIGFSSPSLSFHSHLHPLSCVPGCTIPRQVAQLRRWTIVSYRLYLARAPRKSLSVVPPGVETFAAK